MNLSNVTFLLCLISLLFALRFQERSVCRRAELTLTGWLGLPSWTFFRRSMHYSRGWTPPWQLKTKVKFRGCQHTGCWICSAVISKPPSKLYFGFKIVMTFARQPPDSLDSHLTATRKFSSVPTFGNFCVNVSKMCLGKKYFLSWQLVDSLLTAWQHSDSQGGGVYPLTIETTVALALLKLLPLAQQWDWW